MSSSINFSGYEMNRPASRVVCPPGGAHSDIFGVSDRANKEKTETHSETHYASSSFKMEMHTDSSVDTNGNGHTNVNETNGSNMNDVLDDVPDNRSDTSEVDSIRSNHSYRSNASSNCEANQNRLRSTTSSIFLGDDKKDWPKSQKLVDEEILVARETEHQSQVDGTAKVTPAAGSYKRVPPGGFSTGFW